MCLVFLVGGFSAPDETCLNVQPDVFYAITKKADPSWWCARAIQDGVVTDKVGLIPVDHVDIIGPGLCVPVVEKKEKKKKKKPSSAKDKHRKTAENASSITIISDEAFVRTLAAKDKEIEELKHKLASLEQKVSSLSSCSRCGAEIRDGSEQEFGMANDEGKEDNSCAQLVAEGYDLAALLKLKSLVRSLVMRKRFRKVAMDFKNHKASLVMRLRNESLREIYTSEQKYVDSLLLCMEQLYKPMVRVSRGRSALISRAQLNDIFSTLEIIVELNRNLLNDLRDRLSKWPTVQKFGDLFVRMSPILRLYSGYVRNYEVAQKTLDSMKENAPFAEFLAEREKHTNGLQLESFLIMPVQRLPRYQMLLQGLLKYTDEDHVDFNDINDAQAHITEICADINFQKQMDENSRLLRSLVDDVDGLADVLNESFFIHRGHLHSIKGSSIDSFHYILFSDVLVKAVVTKKKSPSWAVAEALPLSGVSQITNIPDMEGIKNGMELTLQQNKVDSVKSLTLGLCAPTPADKSLWMSKVQTFQTSFRMNEDTAKALHDAVTSVREESSARHHHHHRGSVTGAAAALPQTVSSPPTAKNRMSLRKGKSQTLKK